MDFVRWDEASIPVNALCRLWNDEIGEDFPITERLFRQNSVDSPHLFSEGSLYVMEDNKVIGFIISKFTNESKDLLPTGVGWIQVLLVHNKYRKRGIGERLLKKAEQAFSSAGVGKILLGRDVHHYFPGVPSTFKDMTHWIEKRGYVELNKVKDFYRAAPREVQPLEKTDITLKVLNKDEEDQFLTFLHVAFPGRWEYEAMDYFKHDGDGSHFLVAKYNDDIIGFLRLNDLDSPVIGNNIYWHGLFGEKLGGIGPLGIKKEYRKKGYGAAIVQHGINTAVERGYRHLVIDWTELDEFYHSFGFIPWKEYSQYEKRLD